MLKSYHPLATLHLANESQLMHPPSPPEVIHQHDSALHVMLDFRYNQPVTVSANMSIDDALHELKNHNTPVLIVIDETGTVSGIITSEDIMGEKPVKLIQEGRMKRADIPVSMVMTPQKEIAAFDIEHLRHAKVGNIIQTLFHLKQHTLLVIKFDEHHTGKQIVRGLFSSSMISKQLGEDITSELSEPAQSLAELQHKLET